MPVPRPTTTCQPLSGTTFYSVSAMMLMACTPVPTALAPVQAAPVLRHNGLLSCLTAGTAALACSHGFRHVTQLLC